MTYLELENLYKKEICLFGAGHVGKTTGYEFAVNFLMLKVAFYCDNNIAPGTEIRDGIKVRELQYLYENMDKIQVALTVSRQYQQQITDQLKEHGIEDIIYLDGLLLSQVLGSIEASDDETVKQNYSALYNDVEYIKKFFAQVMGYRLDIEHPKTFNEKLQWLKLYNRKPDYTRMVDKYEMKRFVGERIGDGYTIPTLGVWDSYDEIDFDKLPDQFVLKCTHDSGSIIIVDNKEDFDKEEARNKLGRALGINYYWLGREWPYKNVKPRIIAEPYLCDSSETELKDYKLFCFNGMVKMIQVDFDRFVNHKRNIYNREWEYMPIAYKCSTIPGRIIEKPKCLQDMIEIAEQLAHSIPYVRVDFYVIGDRPVVGEMTFFPESGRGKFVPKEWDKILGDWISLPEKTE